MKVLFNGTERSCDSIEEFSLALDRFDLERQFELWLTAPGGQSLTMLRNGTDAWLMYLTCDGDSGLVTRGDGRPGTTSYTLSNGQVDEYPLSWCIDIDQCYKASAYFFVNGGAKPEFISWQRV